MKSISTKNLEKLDYRLQTNALRTLKTPSNLIDFSSNDYLGHAKSETIFDNTHQYLKDHNIKLNGATGSRLLSGNHILYNVVENFLNDFHQSEATIIFNSCYDANLGFFSSVPQRGDVILYDEFIHASIRDGIQLSNAKSFKYRHNDLEDLEKKIIQSKKVEQSEIYVVTESVFSMDGDSPDLLKITQICNTQNAFLIVDEAHALGVFSAGLIQRLKLQNDVFARIITFGKALGCHGAAILGSKNLQEYLVNFARSFIYTTGLPPHALAAIKVAYQEIKDLQKENITQDNFHPQIKLHENIQHFISEVNKLNLNFISSCSAIHCCVVPGNETVKLLSEQLMQKGFEVKAILSPTVPKNKERLRFCLHSYNSKEEISAVLKLLHDFTK